MGDMHDLNKSPTAHYLRLRQLFADREVIGFGVLFNETHRDGLPPESEMAVTSIDDVWHLASMLEANYYMGNTLLRDSDIFSMAHGLESLCESGHRYAILRQRDAGKPRRTSGYGEGEGNFVFGDTQLTLSQESGTFRQERFRYDRGAFWRVKPSSGHSSGSSGLALLGPFEFGFRRQFRDR